MWYLSSKNLQKSVSHKQHTVKELIPSCGNFVAEHCQKCMLISKLIEGEKCCPYGLSEIRYLRSPHSTISTSRVSRINLLKPISHNLHTVT
jgi:predicted RNA-binding Zn-ribbon protein involved in translation (DUF1610 family)